MSKLDFNDLINHITPMEDFRLKWRFNDEKYDKLPDEHLDQLKTLDASASEFLWDFISNTGLHTNFPFKRDFFRTIDNIKSNSINNHDIKKWLYQRALPFDKPVYLSWQPGDAMVVPWKLFIKYFDSFYYSGSDDLTIIDHSLNWALFFHHDNEIYFGTNDKFIPSKTVDNVDFE